MPPLVFTVIIYMHLWDTLGQRRFFYGNFISCRQIKQLAMWEAFETSTSLSRYRYRPTLLPLGCIIVIAVVNVFYLLLFTNALNTIFNCIIKKRQSVWFDVKTYAPSPYRLPPLPIFDSNWTLLLTVIAC